MTKETNDTAHSPLLPCPFCGYEARLEPTDGDYHGTIHCDDCGASGACNPFGNDDEVIKAWNTRHNSHQDLVDALRMVWEDIAAGDVYAVSNSSEVAIKQALEKAGVTL